MMYLTLSNIKKSFGSNTLFSHASFGVSDSDKIGLVGVNGAGKSTLFQILLGKMEPDEGEMFKNRDTVFGYLEQQVSFEPTNTVWDEVMEVFSPIHEVEAKLEKISYQIEKGEGDVHALIEEQFALTERFDALGGHTYQNMARASLMGLGFTEGEIRMPFHTLSGGQRTKVMLCKILLGNSNLLLLDEPTNHLDISSVEWLEGFLRDYSGAFIVISHDRYFLDKVTNKTIELANQRLTVYPGSYTTYLRLKEENEKALTRRYENTQKEIKRLEGIIEQQKRWNREKNIKTAESKQKVVDRLEEALEIPPKQMDDIKVRFKISIEPGKEVLIAKNLSMRFGSKTLFSGADLSIFRGEKTFLLGPNGCGKTTLLKILMGKLAPITGKMKFGTNVNLGFYDQTQADLDPSKTAFDEVHDAYPRMTGTEVRNAMASFLFRADDVFKEISLLSGGEKARIALLKLMLSGANVLLLDEPTNHLDIMSREALEDALLSYDGTIFAVSHDRYFINKLAGKIYYMNPGGLEKYEGNYDDFLSQHSSVPSEQKEEKPKSQAAEHYVNRKKEQAKIRKIQNRIHKCEEDITRHEKEIADIESLLATQEYAADYTKAVKLTTRLDELHASLDALFLSWEEDNILLEEALGG